MNKKDIYRVTFRDIEAGRDVCYDFVASTFQTALDNAKEYQQEEELGELLY